MSRNTSFKIALIINTATSNITTLNVFAIVCNNLDTGNINKNIQLLEF